MTFRIRLLIAFLLVVLLPMIALSLFIRNEMTARLTAQYERRVGSLVSVIEDDLAHQGELIATSLAVVREAIIADNRFRSAAVDRAPAERRYLLDYASNAMKLTGLSMLQIQDESGRIISSGHFRNEFDRVEGALPRLLASLGSATAIVRARAPDAPFPALARVDSVRLGNRRLTLVAGTRVESRFLAQLARGNEMTVALVYPGGVLSSDTAEGGGADGREMSSPAADAIVRALSVPFADSERDEIVPAVFRVTHPLTELHSLRHSMDRWFLLAVALTGILAVIIVSWLASRISRPIVELAEKTSRIDLDRLDVDFDTSRGDEIGVLSRLLGEMTERLRASATVIKDTERRATLGELARQVNHDIKNGLTPIRNVFRHLAQLAQDDATQLPDVFRDRQSTLDSSISYLENLASDYGRLSARGERRPCNVSDIARRVVSDLRGSGPARLETSLEENAVVLGDPVALRRVLENLVGNAIDSLGSAPGSVTISTATVPGDGGTRVRISVTDTGVGMNEEQRTRVFDDFYTTKENGTGLGLSIVRRLVMDLEGSIEVESEVGRGSRFVVDLPATKETGLGE